MRAKLPTMQSFIHFAFMAFLIASVLPHTADTFGSLEATGYEWQGWIPAITIDLGIILLSMMIVGGQGNRKVWFGLIAFLVISALANIDSAARHILKPENGMIQLEMLLELDVWQFLQIFLMRGSLPLLAAILAEGGHSSSSLDELKQQLAELTGKLQATKGQLVESQVATKQAAETTKQLKQQLLSSQQGSANQLKLLEETATKQAAELAATKEQLLASQAKAATASSLEQQLNLLKQDHAALLELSKPTKEIKQPATNQAGQAEKYECECGRSFSSKQGLGGHKRHCLVAKRAA